MKEYHIFALVKDSKYCRRPFIWNLSWAFEFNVLSQYWHGGFFTLVYNFSRDLCSVVTIAPETNRFLGNIYRLSLSTHQHYSRTEHSGNSEKSSNQSRTSLLYSSFKDDEQVIINLSLLLVLLLGSCYHFSISFYKLTIKKSIQLYSCFYPLAWYYKTKWRIATSDN